MVKLYRTLSQRRRCLCRQTQSGDNREGELPWPFATQTYVTAGRVENPKRQNKKRCRPKLSDVTTANRELCGELPQAVDTMDTFE